MQMVRTVLSWGAFTPVWIKPPFSDKNVRGTVYADGAEFSYNRDTHTLTVRGGIEHIRIECRRRMSPSKPRKSPSMHRKPKSPATFWSAVNSLMRGGMAGSGGNGAAASIQGNVEVNGNVHSTGSMLSDGPNSNHHGH